MSNGSKKKRKRRARLMARYGGCQWPDCPETEDLQMHHVVPVQLGGKNVTSNLVLLCDRHHELIHQFIKFPSRTVRLSAKLRRPYRQAWHAMFTTLTRAVNAAAEKRNGNGAAPDSA